MTPYSQGVHLLVVHRRNTHTPKDAVGEHIQFVRRPMVLVTRFLSCFTHLEFYFQGCLMVQNSC